MTDHYDVLVAGGGLVGLMFAARLAAAPDIASLRIAVVERQTAVAGRRGDEPFDPRVVALTEASRQRLSSAGIWAGVATARTCPYTHMTVRDSEGTGAIEFDASEVHRPNLGHIVENSVLLEAAAARLDRCPGVAMVRGSIETVVRESTGSTRIILDDGRELAAPLLVAADGARSRVREQCGFALRERDYGHSAIVATIRTAAGHGRTARQWFMPRGPLAFLPLSDGDGNERYCSIVWSQDHEVARDLMDLDEGAFRRALTRASEEALGPVEWTGRRHSFPLYRRHAPDYVRPGVVLMGDAAHSIHPLAGQGVNLGFADAAALAEEIARGVLRGLPVGHISTLERYQRRRKPDNLAMMAAMDGFKQLFASDIPALRVLRNRGLSGVHRLQPVKKQIIRLAMDL